MAANEELLRRGTPGLEIDFEIIPDAVHGDSTVAQDALTAAIQSRLVARVNPTFRRVRVVIDNPWAKTLMSELPGGAELYKDLTRAYMRGTSSVLRTGLGSPACPLVPISEPAVSVWNGTAAAVACS